MAAFIQHLNLAEMGLDNLWEHRNYLSLLYKSSDPIMSCCKVISLAVALCKAECLFSFLV